MHISLDGCAATHVNILCCFYRCCTFLQGRRFLSKRNSLSQNYNLEQKYFAKVLQPSAVHFNFQKDDFLFC